MIVPEKAVEVRRTPETGPESGADEEPRSLARALIGRSTIQIQFQEYEMQIRHPEGTSRTP